jgi:hypothetical protein
MRMTIAATALTFSGVGVAHATAPETAPRTSVVTQQPQDQHSDSEDSDKTGLWGFLGLVGRLGLARPGGLAGSRRTQTSKRADRAYQRRDRPDQSPLTVHPDPRASAAEWPFKYIASRGCDGHLE